MAALLANHQIIEGSFVELKQPAEGDAEGKQREHTPPDLSQSVARAMYIPF